MNTPPRITIEGGAYSHDAFLTLGFEQGVITNVEALTLETARGLHAALGMFLHQHDPQQGYEDTQAFDKIRDDNQNLWLLSPFELMNLFWHEGLARGRGYAKVVPSTNTNQDETHTVKD